MKILFDLVIIMDSVYRDIIHGTKKQRCPLTIYVLWEFWFFDA